MFKIKTTVTHYSDYTNFKFELPLLINGKTVLFEEEIENSLLTLNDSELFFDYIDLILHEFLDDLKAELKIAGVETTPVDMLCEDFDIEQEDFVEIERKFPNNEINFIEENHSANPAISLSVKFGYDSVVSYEVELTRKAIDMAVNDGDTVEIYQIVHDELSTLLQHAETHEREVLKFLLCYIEELNEPTDWGF